MSSDVDNPIRCCVLGPRDDGNISVLLLPSPSSHIPNCTVVDTAWDLFEAIQGRVSDEDINFHVTNCFTELNQGQPDIKMEELLPPLLVYSTIFIIGILGNILIILSVARKMTMKSPTNTFLASLATTDLLLIIICLPVKLFKLFTFVWPFGDVVCKGIYYVQDVSVICSVLNLTAMSLERFYAISYPIKSRTICTVRQARKVVCFTWFLALLLALPRYFVQGLRETGVGTEGGPYYHCVTVPHNDSLSWQLFQLYMLFIVLVIPATIMSFAYGSIAVEVFRTIEHRATLAPAGTFVNRPDTASSKANDLMDVVPVNKLTYTELDRSQQNGNGKTNGHSTIRMLEPDMQKSPMRENGSSHNVSLRRNYSRRSTRSSTPKGNSVRREQYNVRQVARMLAMVVIVFIVCWAPVLIFDILQSFGVIPELLTSTLKHIKTCISLLAYFNSCMNPVIYGFMSRNFRQSFVESLCQCRLVSLIGKINKSCISQWTPCCCKRQRCTCHEPFSMDICQLHNISPPARSSSENSSSGQLKLRNVDFKIKIEGRTNNSFESRQSGERSDSSVETGSTKVGGKLLFETPPCKCHEKFLINRKKEGTPSKEKVLKIHSETDNYPYPIFPQGSELKPSNIREHPDRFICLHSKLSFGRPRREESFRRTNFDKSQQLNGKKPRSKSCNDLVLL